MAGTVEGGARAAEKNKKLHPDYYKIIGAKGGRVKTPKGFATMDLEKFKEASAKGGSASRRRK